MKAPQQYQLNIYSLTKGVSKLIYKTTMAAVTIPVFVTNASCNVIIGGMSDIFEALEQYGENVQGYHDACETGDFDLDTDGIETTLCYVQEF